MMTRFLLKKKKIALPDVNSVRSFPEPVVGLQQALGPAGVLRKQLLSHISLGRAVSAGCPRRERLSRRQSGALAVTESHAETARRTRGPRPTSWEAWPACRSR